MNEAVAARELHQTFLLGVRAEAEHILLLDFWKLLDVGFALGSEGLVVSYLTDEGLCQERVELRLAVASQFPVVLLDDTCSLRALHQAVDAD